MGVNKMANNVEDGKLKLTQKDLVSTFWRSTILQASWNYERMQHLGFAFTMVPAIKRLYPNKEDKAQALKRHMEFFNTTPYMASTINGVILAMEEERANGAPIDDATINGVKVGMMGPLAGVGDPIWWATVRPVLGAFAAGLASKGSLLGPIIFFVVWNALRLSFRWYTQKMGYKAGSNIASDLNGGLLPKITQGASILGMFILGVLVPRWTHMYFPTVLSKTKNQAGVSTTTTVQTVLDQLLYGLAPLALTFICMWLLRKKINPIWIILGLFVIGVVMYWAGIIGTAPASYVAP